MSLISSIFQRIEKRPTDLQQKENRKIKKENYQ
jgi:hypothetical protein